MGVWGPKCNYMYNNMMILFYECIFSFRFPLCLQSLVHTQFESVYSEGLPSGGTVAFTQLEDLQALVHSQTLEGSERPHYKQFSNFTDYNFTSYTIKMLHFSILLTTPNLIYVLYTFLPFYYFSIYLHLYLSNAFLIGSE